MSQDEIPRKEARRLEKENRLEEENKQKKEMLGLLYSRSFVIMADEVRDQTGQRMFLTPMTNFVSINGNEAIVQLSIDHMVGWNGLGGITLEGLVSHFRIKEGKETRPASAEIRVTGGGISAHLFLTVFYDRRATIELAGDAGYNITFSGIMQETSESTLFKGRTTY
ncbi:MAG: DUF4251 domain-containing protein [Bacteroidales bacterium]|nr:DUF4251 domain-containing protein [Bacteroidales bacterium]